MDRRVLGNIQDTTSTHKWGINLKTKEGNCAERRDVCKGIMPPGGCAERGGNNGYA
jgi:hypothetical protein